MKVSTIQPKTATPTANDQDGDAPLNNDILNMSSGLSQPPVIVVAQSSSNHTRNDFEAKSHGLLPRDEHSLYSMPLIVTIAIGSTLLLLNILVFVAVYHRDKSSRRRYRASCTRRKRQHEHCDSSCSASNCSSLKDAPDICSKNERLPVENGRIKGAFSTGKFLVVPR